MAYLKDPRYDIVPLLDVIQKEIMGLRKEIDWGYRIPYMLSGIMNHHPGDAMAWMSGDQKQDFVEFYRRLLGDKSF